MLDRTFAIEIMKVGNGDGSREYRFQFRNELYEIKKALSNRYEFDNCLKQYGRTKVGICVAATIISQQYRFERDQILWANMVLALWENRIPNGIIEASINIHPAILADNSRNLRKYTTREG